MTFRDASPEDLAEIERLIGRPPQGRCAVVVRRAGGSPVVIENEPHLRDGTPMPTLYWLVDPVLHAEVSRLESAGVHRFEELVDPAELARTHEEYARRREAATVRHDLVQPRGGVGGTRTGVKCLHAHLANYLAGHDDPVGSRVAATLDLSGLVVAGAVAALDCGSNSTRLLIEGEDGSTWRREMRITRLSEGVDATGSLTAAAIARTLDVLAEYRAMMDEAGVRRGRLVATSAVRDAHNGGPFLAEARRVTGVPAEVLSGNEEAALSYAGATTGLAPSSRVTVVLDIGGGSTELATEDRGGLASYSMQLGCVRVTERALGRGPVAESRVCAATAMIDAELDRAFAATPALAAAVGRVRLVGLAGTVATLAALDAGLVEYQRDAVHHRTLTRDVVRRWRDRLGAETPEVRLTHPGMVPGREDVLVAGLYVLDAVMARLGADELLTSENDILDGIVASLRRPGPRPDTMVG